MCMEILATVCSAAGHKNIYRYTNLFPKLCISTALKVETAEAQRNWHGVAHAPQVTSPP
jgi:hypothetical protein